MSVSEPPKPNLKGYVDTTGEFSNRSLRMAEWYLRHKIQLKKGTGRFLVFINIVLILFSIYGWGRYLFFDYAHTNAVLSHLSRPAFNIAGQHVRFAPQELTLNQVKTYTAGVGNYDFVATMSNANMDWVAEVTYLYAYSGGTTEEHRALILPRTEQTLAVYGVDVDRFPSGVNIEITDIDWTRVDPHKVVDPESFMAAHLDVSVENVDFIPAGSISGVLSHAISFDLTNNSVYSFWSPEFTMYLLNNGTPVAVRKIQVDRFRAGETRTIDLKSFVPNLRVTGVELVPMVNVFDPTVFMEPGL